MEPLKISAKNLGAVALADFCPRCYWIKIKSGNRLPFQSFPGIFSSIDAYTKRAIHFIIDSMKDNPSIAPEWLKEMGTIVGYEPIKHWSKNLYEDKKSGITLSGVPDDILVRQDGSKAIIDWKTSVYSKNQDILMPVYIIQVNVYAVLSGNSETDLYLVYMEPQTAQEYVPGNTTGDGFKMGFGAKVIPVENNRSVVRNALSTTRDIFQMDDPPDGRTGCKECLALENLINLLK
jgi:hypothetical protein